MFAEIYRKVSVTEDLLTSNVFGAFKFLPYGAGLKPFLGQVRKWQKDENENSIHPELEYRLQEADDFEIYFWPRMDDRSEPDAVIILKENGKEIAIVGIEAKHGAGMGQSVEENDENVNAKSEEQEERERVSQVAKEFKNLKNRSASCLRHFEDEYKDNTFLIYLTHHVICPREKLSEALKSEEYPNNVFWASWRDVYKSLRYTLDPKENPTELNKEQEAILENLCLLLTGVGYSTFEGWGFEKDKTVPKLSWNYPVHGFVGWELDSVKVPEVDWEYPFNTEFLIKGT